MDVDIEIVFRDIFTFNKGSIVIPVNDVFDTNPGEIISSNSIQGQFTQQIYRGNISQLDSEISAKIEPYEKYAVYDEDKRYGKNRRFPLGTVIELGNNPKYLLVVVAKMDSYAKKVRKVTTDDLWKILSGIWEYNRQKNSLSDIILPIIGTGHGRITSNALTVTKMILLSFYSKSKEEKIASKITLVAKNDKFGKHSLYELQDFLATLS